MAELLINGVDALTTYGICVGKGTTDSLFAPAGMKSNIENKSRLKDGKSVVVNNPRLDSREVTLTLYLQGDTKEEFDSRRAAFFQVLYAGAFTLQLPEVSDEVFHFVYSKSSSYAHSRGGTFCKIAVKVDEPDPSNRQ